jgi:DNA (cytosine-5)-methyltransferase 1
VAEPFLVPFYGENGEQRPRTHAVDDPLPVQPTNPKFALVEPFVLQQQSGGVPRRVSDPAPTIAADGAISLVEPFILPTGGRQAGRTDSTEDPIRTVTAVAGHTFGLVEPFLTRYYGSGSGLTPASVDRPLDTVTARDRFALVQPVVDGYVLDIRFRMLQPHELAGAMSFPKSYVFTGNKGDQIRQIGNAVDCAMAQALTGAILDARSPRSTKREAVA